MRGNGSLRLQVRTLGIAVSLATAAVATAQGPSADGAPRGGATDESRAAGPAAEAEPRAGAETETETAGPRPDVSAPVAATGSPSVALARFTTAVEGREPVDAVAFLSNRAREVLFYTDLRGLEGETVVHRWEFAGEVMAEVPFEVGGERWRVWSSKALRPEWTGDWTASVIGPQGEVLAIETFTYQPAR